MIKSSSRLILIGVLLVLLVAVRMLTASSSLEDLQDPDYPTATLVAVTERTKTPFASAVTATTLIPREDGSKGTPVPSRTPTPAAKARSEEGESFLAAPEVTRTPRPGVAVVGIPVRIVIPSIGLSAPVVNATYKKILLQGDVFDQWVAPNSFAAGWHSTSALLGETGNTVLSGHHNDFGEVFGKLIDINVGDAIVVMSDDKVYNFTVTNKMVLQELDVPISQRIDNARWIGHSDDVRLTLVTCWPKDTNTHRLVVVAKPN